MDIQVGNIVKLKKQHPCGSREWEVLRVGADFRLKCLAAAIRSWFPGSLWKKCPGNPGKGLKSLDFYDMILLRDI